MRLHYPLLAFTLSVFRLPDAFAQNVQGVIGEVADGLAGASYGGEFGEIARTVALAMLPFVNGVAILIIVIAGLLAVVAQDENRIQNARSTVVSVIVGLILVNVAAAITAAYDTAFDFDGGANPAGGAAIISDELLGLISFIETAVAVIALVVIIISGIKAVIDYTGDKGLEQFKRTFVSIIFGIIVIVGKFLVAQSVAVDRTPSGIIVFLSRIIITVVTYVGYAAVVVIVIAGIFMIVNVGKDEQYERAKGIIVRTLLGLILLAVSAALINLILAAVL